MRPKSLVLLVGALLLSGCGTRSVEVAPTEPASALTEPAPDVSAPPTTSPPTTTSSTTTSSTASTSTTTTTTVPPTLVLDDRGVPVNGQSTGVLRTPTGWVVPVLGRAGDAWRVMTPCGRQADLTEGELIESVDFVLDPGHGGSEPGAVGPAGTREADLNLSVAFRVKEALEADGYTVLMTRDTDVRVPIVTRAEIARAVDPIALISIHHNAGTEEISTEPGTEMWHQLESADSKRLAGLLYEETRRVLDPLGASWFAMGDAGAMPRANEEGEDFYGMLRRPGPLTSVLAEYAYIVNPTEEELLNRADVQDALAEATRAAVERFVTTDDPGSGFTENPLFRGYGPTGAGRTDNCDDPALA